MGTGTHVCLWAGNWHVKDDRKRQQRKEKLTIISTAFFWDIMQQVVIISYRPKQRYQKHTRYIKQNNQQSLLVLQILNNKHKYGPNNNIMSLLKLANNGPLLNPCEKFYIKSHYHQNKLIPKQNTREWNPIYQLIYDFHIMSCQNIT